MADISGLPYFEVQFTKQGEPFDPAEKQAVLDAARTGGLEELFVVSHGWNNDEAEARALYAGLFARVRAALDAGRAPTSPAVRSACWACSGRRRSSQTTN